MGKAIPIATALGLSAYPIAVGLQYWADKSYVSAINKLTTGYLGYNWTAGKWEGVNLMYAYGPIIVGIIISYLASYFGVNRKLPKGINF